MKNRRNIIESELPPQNPFDIWMKDGKFYKSTNKGWVLIENQMEFTNSKLMSKSTATSGTIGVNKETGRASIYNDVTKQWGPLGGGVTETTWQELKDKRDTGKLIPGTLYRITDYQCTTTQENTRSAGHQFDIVLLALSADKLAEEGWAMMHDNIYDVTFSDGVKKCYIYPTGNNEYNVVDIETLLGIDQVDEFEEIDEENKTAILTSYNIALLDVENLTYNYFQNSNLSAWKVWYCLDNDTNRFAWADDRKFIIDDTNIKCYRNLDEDITVDNVNLYGWVGIDINENKVIHWTDTENPQTGDITYDDTHYPDSRIIEIGVSGRGVIYRLIDEWNNDVGYDFKNIQFVRPMTDGEYDAQGTDTWVYTLNNVDAGQGIYDASLNTIPLDNSANNKIDSLYTFINDKNYFTLPDVVILYGGGYNNISMSQIITILQTVVKMNGCQDCIIGNADSQFYFCDTILTTESDDPAIYLNNKKVLTES